MAEPMLKDVLNAITDLRAETKRELAKLDAKIDAHREETNAHREETNAHREETNAHREETNAHREETRKAFAELDAELTGHTRLHREIERDIEQLKRRPPRSAARPPRGPRSR